MEKVFCKNCKSVYYSRINQCNVFIDAIQEALSKYFDSITIYIYNNYVEYSARLNETGKLNEDESARVLGLFKSIMGSPYDIKYNLEILTLSFSSKIIKIIINGIQKSNPITQSELETKIMGYDNVLNKNSYIYGKPSILNSENNCPFYVPNMEDKK